MYAEMSEYSRTRTKRRQRGGYGVDMQKESHMISQAFALSARTSWNYVKGSPNGWSLGQFIIRFDTLT